VPVIFQDLPEPSASSQVAPAGEPGNTQASPAEEIENDASQVRHTFFDNSYSNIYSFSHADYHQSERQRLSQGHADPVSAHIRCPLSGSFVFQLWSRHSSVSSS
jgi:hypothetical protein